MDILETRTLPQIQGWAVVAELPRLLPRAGADEPDLNLQPFSDAAASLAYRGFTQPADDKDLSTSELPRMSGEGSEARRDASIHSAQW